MRFLAYLLVLLAFPLATPGFAGTDAAGCHTVQNTDNSCFVLAPCGLGEFAVSGSCQSSGCLGVTGKPDFSNGGWACIGGADSGLASEGGISITASAYCCPAPGAASPGNPPPPSTSTTTVTQSTSTTTLPDFMPPASPPPAEPSSLTQLSTITSTTVSSSAASTAASVASDGKQAAQQIGEAGHTTFFDGVDHLAQGITKISLSEQVKAEEGDNEDVKEARAQGLKHLAQGTAAVAEAQGMSRQALAVSASQNRLQNVGVQSTGLNFEFSRSKAPMSLQHSLDEMERVAEVPANDLIKAARSADSNQIFEVAAGAKGVTMSVADFSAMIPTFAASEAPAKPSGPVLTQGTSLTEANKAFEPLKTHATSPSPETGKPVAARAPASPPSLGHADLEPLGREDFFGSIGHSSDDDDTIFRRVRRTYRKLQPELSPRKGASTAR